MNQKSVGRVFYFKSPKLESYKYTQWNIHKRLNDAWKSLAPFMHDWLGLFKNSL